MPRTTTCVDSDLEEQVACMERWFQKWRGSLTYVSEDRGCGCCIHLFDVEDPEEAIAEISQHIQADSYWSSGIEPRQKWNEYRKQKEAERVFELCSQAEEAFRVRDYPHIVALLAPIETHLEGIILKKLEISRRHARCTM